MGNKINSYLLISYFFAALTLITACYSLIYSVEDQFLASIQLFMGLMFLFSGLSDFKRKKKIMSLLNFLVATFAIYVFLNIQFFR